MGRLRAPHLPQPDAPSGIGTALAVGFALVFALWLAWGYQLVHAFLEIQRNAADVHATYVRGEQVLSRVRTNVLLSSIYVRDALIDAANPRREESRRELAGRRDEIEEILRTYVPNVPSAVEREHWARLQGELTAYWASREIALTEAGVRGSAEAAALLRREVVPSRNTVLEILDQLGAMQTVANERHQTEARASYRAIGGRLAAVGIGTMLLALLVAVVASRHVRRLERHIDSQRQTEQQTREDLARLSARLVAVQETERQTLARELHDEVGQALTALKMDLGVALRSELPPRAKSALEEAKTIAETTLQGVRDLSQLLHPSTLDDFGLPATLTAYLRSFTQRTGLRAQLAETLDHRLPPEFETCVYRIVQEALNNVAQHSGATACIVALNAGDGMVRLTVEDNGRGLGALSTPPARRGLGVIGMRERAQAFGGAFTIENRAGGGVRVAVTLPFVAEAAGIAETQREAV
jgi:signal transduction histidine kinase